MESQLNSDFYGQELYFQIFSPLIGATNAMAPSVGGGGRMTVVGAQKGAGENAENDL